MTQPPDRDRASHSEEACARLLDRFLLEPDALLSIIAPHDREYTPESRRAVVELLGNALWDVFSHNHTVVDAQGVAYDLGSFRGGAAFIADAIDRAYPQHGATHDYLDFYMGTSLRTERDDVRAFYRWIFRELKDAGCRWVYSFPRLYLVDLGGSLPNDDMLRYDAGKAIRVELEQAERAQEISTFAEQLEQLYRADLERARQAPLPDIVEAYRAEFGAPPEGWPHPGT